MAPHVPTIMAVTPATRAARPRRWVGVVAWAVWALAMVGLAVAARQRPVAGGGGERGHGRGAARQPPPGAPGGLAAARPRAAGGGQRRRLGVRRLWGGGPARGAAGRQLPGRGLQRRPVPVAGLRRLRAAAHPHGVAALAALALVRQAGGRRTPVAGGVVRGRPAAAAAGAPGGREP